MNDLVSPDSVMSLLFNWTRRPHGLVWRQQAILQIELCSVSWLFQVAVTIGQKNYSEHLYSLGFDSKVDLEGVLIPQVKKF